MDKLGFKESTMPAKKARVSFTHYIDRYLCKISIEFSEWKILSAIRLDIPNQVIQDSGNSANLNHLVIPTSNTSIKGSIDMNKKCWQGFNVSHFVAGAYVC